MKQESLIGNRQEALEMTRYLVERSRDIKDDFWRSEASAPTMVGLLREQMLIMQYQMRLMNQYVRGVKK